MCLMERIKEILVDPVLAITKSKKEKSMNKTLLILILSWILVGISFLFSYKSPLLLEKIGFTLSVFLFGILFSIFYSYLTDIIMKILGGKGKYYDSLTATSYSSLPISFGLLLMSIVSAINVTLGLFIGFVAIAVTSALSLSIYFRAIKEFYGTDMFLTFMGFLIILYVIMIAIYISAAFSMGSTIFQSISLRFL